MAIKAKAVQSVEVHGEVINISALRELMRDARGPMLRSIAHEISSNDGFDSQDRPLEYMMREWLMHTANIRKLDLMAKTLETMAKVYKPHD